jgi:phage-related protein
MEIRFYKNSSGVNEIYKFIEKIRKKKKRDVIISKLRLLQVNGHYRLQATCDVKKIKGRPSIYELRCRYSGTIYRLLFGVILNYYYLALIFNKKDQKIRKKYIDLAQTRIKEQEKYEKQ